MFVATDGSVQADPQWSKSMKDVLGKYQNVIYIRYIVISYSIVFEIGQKFTFITIGGFYNCQ